MFVAHLPAGYVLTKKLQNRWQMKSYLLFGLIGSLFPDVDIFYFYLIDGRQTLHHEYWIHIPFYWLVIAIVTHVIIHLFGKKQYHFAALFFFVGIFSHLFLDTIVGKILWLYPLTDNAYYFFEVPAVHGFWVFNFIFHWTFLFEIFFIVWAVFIFLKNRYLQQCKVSTQS